MKPEQIKEMRQRLAAGEGITLHGEHDELFIFRGHSGAFCAQLNGEVLFSYKTLVAFYPNLWALMQRYNINWENQAD